MGAWWRCFFSLAPRRRHRTLAADERLFSSEGKRGVHHRSTTSRRGSTIPRSTQAEIIFGAAERGPFSASCNSVKPATCLSRQSWTQGVKDNVSAVRCADELTAFGTVILAW